MTGAVGMGYSMGLAAFYWPLAWLIADIIFWSYFPDKINAIARNTHSCTITGFIFGESKEPGIDFTTKLF